MHLPILSLLTATTLAATNLIHNNCPFDIYTTSVSSGDAPAPLALEPDAYLEEAQFYNKTGTAIKITRTRDGIYTNTPVLTFAYSYKANTEIYYDLSSHNGFDFWGFRIQLNTSKSDGKNLVWEGEPKPNYTARYAGETDLELTICA